MSMLITICFKSDYSAYLITELIASSEKETKEGIKYFIAL